MQHRVAKIGRWAILVLVFLILAAFSACAVKPAVRESAEESRQTGTPAEPSGIEDLQEATGDDPTEPPQEETEESVRKFMEIGMTEEAAEGLLAWIDWLHEEGKIDDPNIVHTGTATIMIGEIPTGFVVFMTEDNTTYYARMALDYYPPYEIFKNAIADDCCIFWSGEYDPTGGQETEP